MQITFWGKILRSRSGDPVRFGIWIIYDMFFVWLKGMIPNILIFLGLVFILFSFYLIDIFQTVYLILGIVSSILGLYLRFVSNILVNLKKNK